MNQITAEEFEKIVALNPKWADELDAAQEPVEITGLVNIQRSPIQRICKWMRFVGNNDEFNEVAGFSNCPDLTEVDGEFNGMAGFIECPNLKTVHVRIHRASKAGMSLIVRDCDNMESLSGQCKGRIEIMNCGVKSVKDLKVTEPDEFGWAACFIECPRLTRIEATVNGRIELMGNPQLRYTEKLVLQEDFLENMESTETLREIAADKTAFLRQVYFSTIKDCTGLLKLPKTLATRIDIDEVSMDAIKANQLELALARKKLQQAGTDGPTL